MARLILGRGSDADVRIASARVSRKHATLEARANGTYFLRDLGSTGGTYVVREDRWVRVERAHVRAEDPFRMADVTTSVVELGLHSDRRFHTGTVADVFISYAREDRPLAQAFAQRLSAIGLTAWWDRDLIGGQHFRETIEDNLKAATLIAVIWTPNSVTSNFVLDEADVAAGTGKLLSILGHGLPPDKIRIGFRQYQAITMDDDQGLQRALRRYGLLGRRNGPVAPGSPIRTGSSVASTNFVDVEPVLTHDQLEELAWQFVLAQQDEALLLWFLLEFPNSARRFSA